MNGHMRRSLVFQCKARSDIWTGDSQGKNAQLHLTSILGGIRWWAEAIVRSFGGHACDPASRTAPNAVCAKDHLCLICHLFGNPNQPMGAKFALRCWNDDARRSLKTAAIKKDEEFFLEFLFYKSEVLERNPQAYEIWLLAKTLDLISSYGSIGGKTVFKPTAHTAPTTSHIQRWEKGAKYKASKMGRTATNSDIQNALLTGTDAWRFRHSDFGIIKIDKATLPEIPGVDWQAQVLSNELSERMIRTSPQAPASIKLIKLPNFDNFWFVDDFTLLIHPPSTPVPKAGSFNDIIGIADVIEPQNPPRIRYFKDGLDSIRGHLRGTLAVRSKRAFSFSNPSRTWGLVIPGEYQCIHVPGSTIPEETNCKVAVQKLLESVNPSAGCSVQWGDALKIQPISFPVN